MNDLGKKELSTGNYEKAIDWYEKALNVSKDLVEKENLFLSTKQKQISSEV